MVSSASLNRNSYLTSIVVTICLLAMLLITHFGFGYAHSLQSYLLIATIGFLSAFFASKFFFGRYVYQKIKVIYKMIYRRKSPVKGRAQRRISNDIISHIESEVKSWSDLNRKEIEELRQKEIYRKEFLGDVTHELKTPIYNIQGFLETLIDGGIHDEEIAVKYLERASRNVDRLSKIIGEMDQISKMESQRIHFDSEEFDLEELAIDVIELLETRANKRNIKIVLDDTFKKKVLVKGDKSKLKQVFTNILVNSIKYGNENGQTTVSYFDVDDKILVEITDNGTGIEKEHLPHIFTRFYRADRDRSRETGGSGLGLAIVKHIIEGHGQTLNVRSTVGVGTTFGFTLQKADS